ncbi:unnamed protein product [Ranitomeya imitator]|uniref:Secernin-2 n=1 Tax=Ranitomeya imitator TaxID=111125 RepID=A0ABN9LEC3_9NEOB|nr:unnamed protein product [Ranitomeya imitator]
MAAYPSSCDCFVSFPPASLSPTVVFAKNSDRPRMEVQEVVYYGAATYPRGAKVMCTYIEVEQAPRTLAVLVKSSSLVVGCRNGCANEMGVCIGNEAVWTKEPVEERDALLGMDFRSDWHWSVPILLKMLSAGKSLTCSPNMDREVAARRTPEPFMYHNTFLLCDRLEAYVLETAGQLLVGRENYRAPVIIYNQLSVSTSIWQGQHLSSVHLPGHRGGGGGGWWNGTEEFNFRTAYFFKDTTKCVWRQQKQDTKLGKNY